MFSADPAKNICVNTMWNLTNITTYANDAIVTCGEWCREQHYIYDTGGLYLFPLAAVIALFAYKIISYYLDKHQDKISHSDRRVLLRIKTALIDLALIMQIGILMFLAFFFNK